MPHVPISDSLSAVLWITPNRFEIVEVVRQC